MAPFPTGLGWCQHTQRRKGRGRMKSAEEIMNVLEAYDLTGSYRDAAELAGCSHHTVAHYVALRAAGKLTAGQGARRPQLVDEFLPKLEELVDRSHGRVRADVAHRKLAAMGFTGCEGTTRQAAFKPAIGGCTGRGCPSRACGPSTTSATGPGWPARRRCCSASGWPGAAFGWCCRCWTRPCPACTPRCTWRCAGSAACRRICSPTPRRPSPSSTSPGCPCGTRPRSPSADTTGSVSYTHLRAHETRHDLVCRLLLEKKK